MKFTLNGFEDFLLNSGTSLFDSVPIPEGSELDIIKATILERYGEMETLYADPFKMKFSTMLFFKKHQRTFNRWYEAINMDFEPLYNFDRYEEWEDNGEGSRNAHSSNEASTLSSSANNDSSTNTGSITRTTQNAITEANSESSQHTGANNSNDNMSINESTSENSSSDKLSSSNNQRNTASDDTHKVGAYNSSTLPDNEKSLIEGYEAGADSSVENGSTQGASQRSGNNSTAHSGADFAEDDKTAALSRAENGTITDSDNRSTSGGNSSSTSGAQTGSSNSSESNASHGHHTGHLYGNIGVTTSAQLLREYLNVSEWGFYEHVADLYAEELLLMVY